MIFLVVQTIKENTNHNGLMGMLVLSTVLGVLFFRKIQSFKKWNIIKRIKVLIKVLMISGLILLILVLPIKFIFWPPQYLVNAIGILGLALCEIGMFLIQARPQNYRN
jgi:predicted ferric reductase